MSCPVTYSSSEHSAECLVEICHSQGGSPHSTSPTAHVQTVPLRLSGPRAPIENVKHAIVRGFQNSCNIAVLLESVLLALSQTL